MIVKVPLPRDHLGERSHIFYREDKNWNAVIACERDCRGIHHFKVPRQDILVRKLIIPNGVLVDSRIGIIDAIYLGRLQHCIAAHFSSPQCGSRISGEERISCA